MLTNLQAIEWSDLAAATVVLGFVGGCVYSVLGARLATRFVPVRDHAELKREHDAVQVRVQALEVGIAQLPTRAHLNEVSRRVEHVADLVATNNGQLSAVSGTIGSVEKTLNLVLQSQLEREAK